MRITGAKWAGGELRLATADPEAIRFALAFKDGDYQITKSKKPRSLDANAYAWVLIDKLSAALHMGREEIYRNTIMDIGGVSDVLCMTKAAYTDFKRHWESKGLGWQAEAEPSSKLENCVVVTAFYGSSAYDTQQMSCFIDHLVQDCQALGIETDTGRISSLLEAWDARQ